MDGIYGTILDLPLHMASEMLNNMPGVRSIVLATHDEIVLMTPMWLDK